MKKWFRYVSFPCVWVSSLRKKILERKKNDVHSFEENIEFIIKVGKISY